MGGLELGTLGEVVLKEAAGCQCYVAGPKAVIAEGVEGVRADGGNPPTATFPRGLVLPLHELPHLLLACWGEEEETPQHFFLIVL